MSESAMRRRVVKALKSLDAVSIESSTGKGIPDVNYVEGWIELKWLREWPKRASTKVRVPHFTKEQRLWLRRRAFRGGNAFLLMQCKTDWLLFDSETANEIGKMTLAELKDAAILYMPVFDSKKLKGALCASQPQKPIQLLNAALTSPGRSTSQNAEQTPTQ